MFSILFLSIFLTKLQFLSCTYLEAEANYQKSNQDRNNILNKGVWVHNNFKQKSFDKTPLGAFVFRTNSLDADRIQTNFETFSENDLGETPFVPRYVERVRRRRSPDQIRKRNNRKIIKSKRVKKLINSIEDSKSANSRNYPNLNPVWTDLPHELVLLINNNSKEVLNLIKYRENNTQTNETIIDKNNEVNTTIVVITETKKNLTKAMSAETNLSAPKRSKKHSYGIDNNEPLNMLEDFNNTGANVKNKSTRYVFNKDNRIWHQNAPIPDTNMYEVVHKDQEKPNRVTETGLIKVISMLTKTFKKITKQHNQVKLVYEKFNAINDVFHKQINDINIKFQDFDSKYSDMIQFSEKLKSFEDKLINEEQYLKNKRKDMENNVIEFENQQQKFLAQQKQFYAIQKIMLAHNEKINVKQSTIARTQSEIALKQSNFARILKKAKQLYIDSKQINQTQESNQIVINRPIDNHDIETTVETTTVPTSPTESIKLNLFSIPTKNKLPNQDELIISEKDEKPIDDLIYKYYFNNTFIDNIIKNKILNNYATSANGINIARNIKNKREELGTTILLPISSNSIGNKKRVRRWINYFNDKKYKTLPIKNENTKVPKNPDLMKNDPNSKADPFLTMAQSFCNEIGQNTNEQTLNWCIEKALRRLRYMEKKLFSKPTATATGKPQILNKVTQYQHTTLKPAITLVPFAPSTVWLNTKIALEHLSTPPYIAPNQDIFFPDNEELESNLQQFDLTPDMEGTVYYDGSLHISDIGDVRNESDGMSDFMPALVDSNSLVEMNPMAFDLQAKRRAYVNRLNEDIMKKYKHSKL